MRLLPMMTILLVILMMLPAWSSAIVLSAVAATLVPVVGDDTSTAASSLLLDPNAREFEPHWPGWRDDGSVDVHWFEGAYCVVRDHAPRSMLYGK